MSEQGTKRRTLHRSLLLAVLMVLSAALAGCAADEGGDGDGAGDGTGADGDAGNDTGAGDGGAGDGGAGDDGLPGGDDLVDDNLTGNDTESMELNITAQDDPANGEYWFEVEGYEGRNPNITLTEGQQVTVNFENMGSAAHNVHFGGAIGEATDIIASGESATLSFTVPGPDEGDAEGVSTFEESMQEEGEEKDFYWCDPHFAQGMWGGFEIEPAEDGGLLDDGTDVIGGGEDNETTSDNATGDNTTSGNMTENETTA